MRYVMLSLVSSVYVMLSDMSLAWVRLVSFAVVQVCLVWIGLNYVVLVCETKILRTDCFAMFVFGPQPSIVLSCRSKNPGSLKLEHRTFFRCGPFYCNILAEATIFGLSAVVLLFLVCELQISSSSVLRSGTIFAVLASVL
jgi:hypothetical protein